MLITSARNPKIKALKKLDKASERREQGMFVIEGMRELCLADGAGYEITQLFICEELLTESEEYNLKQCKLTGTEVFEINKEVYESVAYRGTTEGVIATAKPKEHTLDSLKLSANPLILVIEGVEKPGNLGAMLRTCDAVGVDAVIVCDTKTDVYNPNAVRSGVGTVFTNQIAVATADEVIIFLKERHITTYAAELTATDFHYQKDLAKPAAIIVGEEATGISAQWMEAADQHIRIPMLGRIDSLNVSVSAAVLLYEALRQRHVAQVGGTMPYPAF
ncbi:MAG: rRNA methylase [Bacteroidetes bacterium]|nr:rRNA methylase [Bacteroidota bacterium]